MKKLISILCIVVALTVSDVFASEEKNIQQERAIIASNLFKKICFMMHSQSQVDKRIEFLNSKFPKFENGRQDVFLNMLKVSKGDAWGAVFPKGNFVIVVDYETTNCHLIAEKSDADIIHERIKILSNEGKRFLPDMIVKYKPPEKSEIKISSGFEIKSKSGINMTIVLASTYAKPAEGKPEALLTVAVK